MFLLPTLFGVVICTVKRSMGNHVGAVERDWDNVACPQPWGDCHYFLGSNGLLEVIGLFAWKFFLLLPLTRDLLRLSVSPVYFFFFFLLQIPWITDCQCMLAQWFQHKTERRVKFVSFIDPYVIGTLSVRKGGRTSEDSPKGRLAIHDLY